VSGLEPGSTLGGYKILARLRAGAMGVLYLARRLGPAGFARPVAIKVIHEHLAQNKRFCRMFIAEAKLSAQIDDPHVVRVEEFGEADGRYFLVMEYVYGVSLAQALGVLRKRGGLPIDVCVAIAMDVASGLHAAHEAVDENGQPLGIVHRDVSPHNVLVSYKGHVKVIDFGIAKAKEGAGQTLTGSIRGKLAYMPPEQARSAKHVDRRADLYALGLILWEMLVGRRMFQGKSDIALLNMIRNPTIVPPSVANNRVPKVLDSVVMNLLEQDPELRPVSGVEVARMLAMAWPTATKVLAADIAAVMNVVREVATNAPAATVLPNEPDPDPTASGGGDEEDDAQLYGDEIKKGITLFDEGMSEAGEGAADVAATRGSNRDVNARAKAIDDDDPEPPGNKTAVMKKPVHPGLSVSARGPMNRPMGAPHAPPEIRQTMRLDSPSQPPAPPSSQPSPISQTAPSSQPSQPSHGPVSHPGSNGRPLDFDEITKNHQVQKRPDGSGALPIMPPESQPLLDIPPEAMQPPPKPAQPAIGKLLSAPVLTLLTVVFVALAVLMVMQCSKPNQNSSKQLTTSGNPNAPKTPIENAREAAAEGNSQAVRGYLEKGVRGGKASTEEVQLVMSACIQMGDTRCVDDVSKKYPSVPRPSSLGL
jgi:serine/threonine protein kinase